MSPGKAASKKQYKDHPETKQFKRVSVASKQMVMLEVTVPLKKKIEEAND